MNQIPPPSQTSAIEEECGDPYSGIGCPVPGCTHRLPPVEVSDWHITDHDVVADLDVIRLTLERADHECRAWKSEAELWKTSYTEERKLVRFLLVIFVIMLIPTAIAAAVLVNLYVG
jgi:hypothetical protein